MNVGVRGYWQAVNIALHLDCQSNMAGKKTRKKIMTVKFESYFSVMQNMLLF